MALTPSECVLCPADFPNVSPGTSETTLGAVAPPPNFAATSPAPGVRPQAIEVAAIGIVPRAAVSSGNNLTLRIREYDASGNNTQTRTVNINAPLAANQPVTVLLSPPMKCDLGNGIVITGQFASAAVAIDVTVWTRLSGADLPEQRLTVGLTNI